MGIFDRFRHHKDNAGGGTALKDRASQMMSDHPDQVDKGMDRAGQMIDEKTGHRFTDQIDTGMDKGRSMLSRERDAQAGSAVPQPNPETGETPPLPPQPPQG